MKKTIVEYKIIHETIDMYVPNNFKIKLDHKVEHFLKEGFQPHGDLIIEQKGDFMFLFQTMVKWQ